MNVSTDRKNFDLLHHFSLEVLGLLDQGKVESIESICAAVEEQRIVEHIVDTYGWRNRLVSWESMCAVNSILALVYVSSNEAANRGIEKNGLAYLICIIQEILNRCLYDILLNHLATPDVFIPSK